MLQFAVASILRGFRTSDTQRITVGAVLVLAALYRRSRRRGGVIRSYELREGDQITVRIPRGRGVDDT